MDLDTTYFRTDVECALHPREYHRYPDDLDGGTWEEGRQAIEDFDWGDTAQCKSPDLSWEEGLQEIEDFDWGEEPRVEQHLDTDEVHNVSTLLSESEVTPQTADDELADTDLLDVRVTDTSRDVLVQISEDPAVQPAPVGSPPWIDFLATEIDVITTNTDTTEPILEDVSGKRSSMAGNHNLGPAITQAEDVHVQEDARVSGTPEQITKTTNAPQSALLGMVDKDIDAKVSADKVHVESKPATEEVVAQTFSNDDQALLKQPTTFENSPLFSAASSITSEGDLQGQPLEEVSKLTSIVYSYFPGLSFVSEIQERIPDRTPRAPEVAGTAGTVATKLPQYHEEDRSVSSIENCSARSSLRYDHDLPELPGFPSTAEEDEIDALFCGVQADREDSEYGDKSDAAVSDVPLVQNEADAQDGATNQGRRSIFEDLKIAAAGISPEDVQDAPTTSVEIIQDATSDSDSTQMDRVSLDRRYGPDTILVPKMTRLDIGDGNLLRELARAPIQANDQDKTFASDLMKLDIGDGDQLGVPKMPSAYGAKREDDTDTFSELSDVPSHISHYEVSNSNSMEDGFEMGGDNNKGTEATDNTHKSSDTLNLSQHKLIKPAIPANAWLEFSGKIEPAEPNKRVDDVDGGDNAVFKREDNRSMDLSSLSRSLLGMPLTSPASTQNVPHTATHSFPPVPSKPPTLKTRHELKRPRFLLPKKPFSNGEDDNKFKPESDSNTPVLKKAKTKGEKGGSTTSRVRAPTADKKKDASILSQISTTGDKKPEKGKKQQDKPLDDKLDTQDEDPLDEHLDETAPSRNRMTPQHTNSNTTAGSFDSKLYLPYGRRTTRGDTKTDTKRPNYKIAIDVDGDSDSNYDSDSSSSSSDVSDSAPESTASRQHTPSTDTPFFSSKAAPKTPSKTKPKTKANPPTPHSSPKKNRYGYPTRATRAQAAAPGPGRSDKGAIVGGNNRVKKRSPPKKRQTRAAAAAREEAMVEQERADNIGKRTRRAEKGKKE